MYYAENLNCPPFFRQVHFPIIAHRNEYDRNKNYAALYLRFLSGVSNTMLFHYFGEPLYH